MFDINIFSKLKEEISPKQLAERELGSPRKISGSNWWYISPFRNEKTASFCVNDEKGFHDFGDSSHYDIISFMAKKYNTSNNEAAKLIANMFGIRYNTDLKEKEFAKMIKDSNEKRALKEEINKWFVDAYKDILENYKIERQYLSTINIENILKFEELPNDLYYKISLLEFCLNIMEREQKEDIYNDKKTKEMIDNARYI